jgi:hypothetical protein
MSLVEAGDNDVESKWICVFLRSQLQSAFETIMNYIENCDTMKSTHLSCRRFPRNALDQQKVHRLKILIPEMIDRAQSQQKLEPRVMSNSLIAPLVFKTFSREFGPQFFQRPY